MAKPIIAVVGRPNVGKSTFINSFAGAARAKAANKPGVTRGKQWITVDDYDLMDMPGVLWKKFDSLETASLLQHLLGGADGADAHQVGGNAGGGHSDYAGHLSAAPDGALQAG